MFSLPVERNVEVLKGDTFVFSFVIKDTVDGVTSARDMTGATASGQVRTKPDSTGTLIATMTLESSAQDLIDGTIIMKIDAATTEDPDVLTGSYFYDIYVDDGTNVLTYFSGRFTIRPRVTEALVP